MSAPMIGEAAAGTRAEGAGREARIEARIVQAKLEAEGIVSFVLRASDGGDLPAWTPGAHLDLYLPSGLIRQYSLCGDPGDRKNYRIAVLRNADGRGGSREVHGALRVGQTVEILGPRNHFALEPAENYLFVAAGIGITPVLPMVRAAARSGSNCRMVYAAASRERTAFLEELGSLGDGLLDLRLSSEGNRIGIDEIAEAARQDAHVYACGPAGLLDAIEERLAGEGLSEQLHLERFKAALKPLPDDGTVRVFLARSGGHVDVPADTSILEALRQAGHDHPSSCEQGYCGTCECGVVDGTPDHRDDLLSEKERAEGKTMMVCVSRARTPSLTLDI